MNWNWNSMRVRYIGKSAHTITSHQIICIERIWTEGLQTYKTKTFECMHRFCRHHHHQAMECFNAPDWANIAAATGYQLHNTIHRCDITLAFYDSVHNCNRLSLWLHAPLHFHRILINKYVRQIYTLTAA